MRLERSACTDSILASRLRMVHCSWARSPCNASAMDRRLAPSLVRASMCSCCIFDSSRIFDACAPTPSACCAHCVFSRKEFMPMSWSMPFSFWSPKTCSPMTWFSARSESRSSRSCSISPSSEDTFCCRRWDRSKRASGFCCHGCGFGEGEGPEAASPNGEVSTGAPASGLGEGPVTDTSGAIAPLGPAPAALRTATATGSRRAEGPPLLAEGRPLAAGAQPTPPTPPAIHLQLPRAGTQADAGRGGGQRVESSCP
mmetsp:Transcript_102007/g.263692  ORF Transcript_102007/g.263692 Transcript_102007/m.263692 type:complete len:256 (+) Transcript_102007:910-1677(+)